MSRSRTLAFFMSTTLGVSLAVAAPPPATLGGQVFDTQGKPLAGALIWIKPAVTTGLLSTHANEKGQYQSVKLPNIPYYAIGYYQTEYHGQSYCLRLAPEKPGGEDAFTPDPRAGTVRNFRLQLSGKIPDSSGYPAYFGAEVRLMWKGDYDAGTTVPADSQVWATFTPEGPMIDGTTGKTLTLKGSQSEAIIKDVPVGHYRVTATEVHADGHKSALIVGQDGATLATSTLFDFHPSGGCGGASSNVGRAFLYVARP